jgi:hypothetical protein
MGSSHTIMARTEVFGVSPPFTNEFRQNSRRERTHLVKLAVTIFKIIVKINDNFVYVLTIERLELAGIFCGTGFALELRAVEIPKALSPSRTFEVVADGQAKIWLTRGSGCFLRKRQSHGD